ncbi:MAG: 50S ribosomal protein L10 [Bacteroidota bacterium]
MKRSEKELIITEVKDQVARAKSMFFADFTGITVEEINELRREFRKSNVDYRVVKNTLVRKALEGVSGYDKVNENLVGPTAIAFGYDDPVLPAKIIKKFRDKHQKLNVKVCILESRVFEGRQLDDLAKLPSRAETVAGILGTLQAPVAGIVGCIAAVMRDLVYVVDAIEKKKAA